MAATPSIALPNAPPIINLPPPSPALLFSETLVLVSWRSVFFLKFLISVIRELLDDKYGGPCVISCKKSERSVHLIQI